MSIDNRRRGPGGVVLMGPREHGTTAGFSQHRRRNEQPCRACRRAENERERSYRGRQRSPAELGELGLAPTFGRFAGTFRLHTFTPMFPGTLGSAQCGECFGWPDDPRHQAEEVAAA